MRGPAARKRARQQLVRHLILQFAHLLAADRAALAPFDFLGPGLGLLAYDRGGQELLLHAQSEQALALLLKQKESILMRTNPAAAFHLQSAAGLQRVVGELALQIFPIDGKVSGQSVDNEVLEPHGGVKSG